MPAMLPPALSESPLLFAAGLFLVALGLLMALLTPWLSPRLAAWLSVLPLPLPLRMRPPRRRVREA